MYYIYEIRNKLHRTSYIGRTSNFNARVSSHNSNLRAGTHECIMMQREYIERYMHYNILATTDDIEIAKKLENLFIYKVISHRGKIYNKIQVSFPTKLAILNDKTINCYIDSRTLLYAFLNGEFTEKTFIKICKILNKENLLDIIFDNEGNSVEISSDYKISLPAEMVKALGVTQEDKAVSVDYVDGKIVIEKKISHDKGRQ